MTTLPIDASTDREIRRRDRAGRTARPAPAPRGAVLVSCARWWSRREIHRRLDGLRVAGLEDVRRGAAAASTIFVSNHVSFWDAFVLLVLDDALGLDGRALMDAENLCRVPLFRRLGGIPVNRSYPRAGLETAAAVLRRPGAAVWVFPQGKPRPAHLRPLRFQPGITFLAKLAPGSNVVPVGLQYAFADAPAPAAYVSFGAPLDASRVGGACGIETLEAVVAGELERIDRHLEGEQEPFEWLVAPHGSVRPDGWRMRWLDRLTAARP